MTRVPPAARDSSRRGVELRVPAKVNLHLRVLARRESGYHSVETVLAAVELYDHLRVERSTEAGRVELGVEGGEAPELEVRDNLAHRAAVAYMERAGEAVHGTGIRLHLTKGIPEGAGLGGGSADAAFVLRALEVLFDGAVGWGGILELAARLGSDVPFFLAPTPFALAWGRGERLLPLPPPPAAPMVLALPPVRISTPWAFGALARGDGRTDDRPALIPEGIVRGEWRPFLEKSSSGDGFPANDFEDAVFHRHPELADIRASLEAQGGRPARLTGSGAALFALFGSMSEARAAAEVLETRFDGVRFVATRTLTSFPAPGGGDG